MAEFDLIRRLHERIGIGPAAADVPAPVLGIGDDAAILEVPHDHQLVVTTDSLVEGVHFLPGAPATDLGHKALAVNLSDLAAMGAKPAWYFLALTLPAEDPDWLDSFAAGMSALAARAGAVLAGGDTTSGPLSITVTALGLVETGTALSRNGARPGDLVVVSGTPGEAAWALARLIAGESPDPAGVRALGRPEPRLALGRALRGQATACIDISDGLHADLGHILEGSGVGAELALDALPVSETLSDLEDEKRWSLQLGGGDDYELCFTLPPRRQHILPGLSEPAGARLTVIGRIVDGSGLVCRTVDGERFSPRSPGYEHFSGVSAAGS